MTNFSLIEWMINFEDDLYWFDLARIADTTGEQCGSLFFIGFIQGEWQFDFLYLQLVADWFRNKTDRLGF
jgi:hypothetical protein